MKRPNEYSDDEIYEMLKPKLEKAGLNSPTFVDYLTGKQYSIHQKTNDGYRPLEFGEKTKQAIALAYKSGYLRAQKGRSFIIGEKKPTTKVRFIDNNAHKSTPEFYPPVGTIGILLQENDNLFVDWGKNSGVEKSCGEYEYTWYCEKSQVEVIE